MHTSTARSYLSSSFLNNLILRKSKPNPSQNISNNCFRINFSCSSLCTDISLKIEVHFCHCFCSIRLNSPRAWLSLMTFTNLFFSKFTSRYQLAVWLFCVSFKYLSIQSLIDQLHVICSVSPIHTINLFGSSWYCFTILKSGIENADLSDLN